MRRTPYLFLCFLFVLGCSRRKAEAPQEAPSHDVMSGFQPFVREERLAEPSIAVVLRSQKGDSGAEMVTYRNIHKLPLSHRNFSAYEGIGYNGTDIFISLFRREEDSENPGNLLLKFEVADRLEVFDVPLVSWNQEDDLELLAGDAWLLKLTRHSFVEDK